LATTTIPAACPAAGPVFGGETLHAWFRHTTCRRPTAPAVTSAGRTLSYAELDRVSDALACRVLAAAGPGRRVGLLAGRTADLAVGMLGILKAGCAYVPLDPAYPADRLAVILDEARPAAVVAPARLAGRVPPGPAVVTVGGPAGRGPTRLPEAGPDDAAYVIFTSGSTGRPKGVEVTHRNVVRLFTATDAWFRFGPTDVWSVFHSPSFDFSVWELWGALLYGGRAVLVPRRVARSPADFLRLLRRERVTVLNQTPSAFYQQIRADGADPGGVPSLRLVIFGGEALSLPALRPWLERYGDAAPRLVNMYGITETTVHVTYRPITVADLDGPPASPIGRPIPDLRVYLLGPDRRPVADREVGEIYVAGPGVAAGYVNRPERTAERFLPDPFAGGRMYRSGDLARRLPSGELVYLGRADAQVKVRGFRVEPGEVEAVLAGHPAVGAAVVVAREDRPGDRRLVAYIAPRAGASPDPPDVRAYARRRLPEHMVPSAVVALPGLPLTAHGKVDRAALPPPGRGAAPVGDDPPGSEAERVLREVWERVLGSGPVGPDEGFFDLGGDSLSAVQACEEATRMLGRPVSPADLFAADTPRSLAARLDRASAPAGPECLVLLRPGGSRPPFFCVHAIGGQAVGFRAFARYMAADRSVYGIQAPELFGGRPPDSLEEMADRYAAAVERTWPDGPYHLGGHSMGALVAYEMARHLADRGRPVGLVAAIDDGPGLCPWLSGWGSFSPWRMVVNLPGWVRHQVRRAGASGMTAAAARRVAVRARCLLGVQPGVAEVVDIGRFRPEHLPVIEAHYRLARAYRPGPYPGRVWAFRARVQPAWGGPPADLGWGRLAAGGVEMAVVPGDHETVVRNEGAAGLAAALDGALREADAVWHWSGGDGSPRRRPNGERGEDR
jgi:nonribosomal peptide synthetase DhbF